MHIINFATLSTKSYHKKFTLRQLPSILYYIHKLFCNSWVSIFVSSVLFTVVSSSDMVFGGNHAIVRRAVGLALLDPQLDKVVTTFDQIGGPLSTLADVLGNDTNLYKKVTKDLLSKAFKQTGGTPDECVVTYGELLITNADITDGSGIAVGDLRLLIRHGYREGRGGKYYEFYRFNVNDTLMIPSISEDHTTMVGGYRVPKAGYQSSTIQHPLSSAVTRRQFQLVSEDVKSNLKSYLKVSGSSGATTNDNKTKKKRPGSSQSARSGKSGSSSKKKSNSPTKKPASKRTKEDIPEEELKLQLEIAKQKTKMLKLGLEMGKKKGKLQSLVRERMDKEQQQTASNDNNNTETNNESASNKQNEISKKSDTIYNYTKNDLIHYILPDGRSGSTNKYTKDIIFVDDLLDGLEPIPDDKNDAKSAKIRADRSTKAATFGVSHAWIPVGTTLLPTEAVTKMKKDQVVMKKLREALSHGKCALSPEAQSVMAAYNLHNYGGSDEGTLMVQAGTLAGLFTHLGLEYDPEGLAKGLLGSERSNARYECKLAAECMMKVMQEIKDDGAKVVAAMGDHGHRGGQDHYVVVLVWSGKDDNGNKTVKFFVPSIDKAGHKTKNVGDAVKNVLDKFCADEGIKLHNLMGDAGGGGAVQHLVKKLIDLKVVDADCKWANCVLHGLQKALENPSKKIYGDQGMGRRNPWQMLYVFSLLMKYLRTEGGYDLLDALWSTVIDTMTDSLEEDYETEWEFEAVHKLKQAWMDFMDKVEAFGMDIDDPEEVEKVLKFMNEAPRNIQDPVWTRWQSIIKTSVIFIDNYAQIYFLAVGCKSHFTSESYVWKLACTLISLMNERATALTEELTDENGDESVESLINSFTSEEVASQRGCDKLEIKPGDSPTFLTMLHFHKAFCDSAFNDNFEFMKRNDLYFGPNTHGQLARHMAERTYVIWKQMQDLIPDVDDQGNDIDGTGWMNPDNTNFAKYREALEGVPEKSDHVADRAFFDKIPAKFFAIYQNTLNDHVLTKWRSNELVWYGLGGNKYIAKELASWLLDYDVDLGGEIVDGEGQPIVAAAETQTYQFTDKMVNLGPQHNLGKGDIKVNLKKCMEYITMNADRKVVRNDPFVEKYWKHIKKLALSPDVVDLFAKKADGSHDTTSWGEYNFMELHDAIWREVAIQPHHQQRCENFVQMAALIARTLVGESRRTWRAISISTLIRRFNMWALEEVKKAEKDLEKRKKIKRVRGSKRVELFTIFIKKFRIEVERARSMIDEEQYKKIWDSIATKEVKADAAEKKRLKEEFAESVLKALKFYKAEQVSGYDQTAAMGGKLLLSVLSGKNGFEKQINDEVVARGITTTQDFIDKHGEDVDLNQLGIKDKKECIKQHEAEQLVKSNEHITKKDAYDQAKHAITPYSDSCKAILEAQTTVVNRLEQEGTI